jgi:type VI secretion system secreted protein VgrG
MTMDPMVDSTTAELRVLSGVLARPEEDSSGFTVVSMTGEEAVSELFAFDFVVLVAPDHLHAADDEGGVERALLMHDVSFRVGPGGNLRYGIVSEVDLEGSFSFDERVFARLRVRVQPRAWLLTQRRNSRIFQHKYVHEIVSAVLFESGVRHRWDLQNTYPRRIYCTQYEETDYDFVRRLFAEEGILFYFEFQRGFEEMGRARVAAEEGEFDELIGHLDKANKIFGSATKEAKNIAKKTKNEREEGAFDALGSVTGLVGDLLEQHEDEEAPLPRVIGSGHAGASGDGDVLVFVDTAAAYGWGTASDERGGRLELVLRDQAGLIGGHDQIDRLAAGWKTRPLHAETRDYDFRRPLLDLQARVGGTLEEHQPGLPLEVYDHHGEYDIEDIGAEGARLQLEQHRRDAALAHGRGRSARILAGHRFAMTALIDHGREAFPPDGEYAITRVHHQYDNPSYGGAVDGVENMVRGCARAIREALVAGRELPENELRQIIRGMNDGDAPRIYQNRFDCIAASLAFRPPRPPRVTRHVTETATVMGPEGKDIHHDRFGRVKVQFHWDREGKFNAQSSCWLRVAQPWAGAGYGFQFFPRIGMEVLVTFIGGDTDRPVVVGALYNGTHATPEALPERMTRSGIRTQTSPHGGGFNELSFEDQKEKERVYIHAQRNFEEVVQHDHDVTVGNRQSLSIGGDQRTGVGGDQVTLAGKNRSDTVGENASLFVGGSSNTRVAIDKSELVDQNKTTVIGGMQVTRVNHHDLKTVRGKLSVTAKSGASFQVTGALESMVTATAYVQGSAYVTAKERIFVRTQKEEAPAMIRFECGNSVIEMRPDSIRMVADEFNLQARNHLTLRSKDSTIEMDDKVQIEGVAATMRTNARDAGLIVSEGAACLYAQRVEVEGSQVDFSPGSSGARTTSGVQNEATEEPNVTLRFTHHAADDSEPIADTPYRVIVGERVYEDSTNGDGELRFHAPDEALSATVILMANATYPDVYPGSPLEYYVSLHEELPAVDEAPGVVVRLANLGYAPALTMFADGEELTPSSAEALTAFQFDHGIAETGEIDDDTKSKLREVYGS